MLKISIVVFLLLFVFFAQNVHSHECIHDQLEIKLEKPSGFIENQKNTHLQKRILEESFQPIRIGFYYDYQDPNADQYSVNIIKNFILPEIQNYFSKLLMVRRVSGMLTVSPSLKKCINVTVPTEHKSVGVSDIDLLVYVTVVVGSSTDTYLAWAGPCDLSSNDLRPIAGQINLNTRTIQKQITKWDLLMKTIIHEITHILVFSPDLAAFYVDAKISIIGKDNIYKNVVSRGLQTQIMNLSNILNFTKTHFSCPSVLGPEVENQGSQQSKYSHWERRLFYNEIMTASINEQSVISNLTLSLYQDSGWYQVNFSNAEDLKWGKNKGCTFLNEQCIKNGQVQFVEFCSEINAYGCSYTGFSKAICFINEGSNVNSSMNYFGNNSMSLDPFSDNCPYFYAQYDCRISNYKFGFIEEKFGQNSKCFTGTAVLTSKLSEVQQGKKYFRCIESYCVKDNSNNYKIVLYIGKQVAECTSDFQKLSLEGYTGTIDCPIISQYCPEAKSSFFPKEGTPCLNNCSGHGTCSKGQCICADYYTGSDCSESFCYFNCSNRGTCNKDTTCQCQAGYTGQFCSQTYSYHLIYKYSLPILTIIFTKFIL